MAYRQNDDFDQYFADSLKHMRDELDPTVSLPVTPTHSRARSGSDCDKPIDRRKSCSTDQLNINQRDTPTGGMSSARSSPSKPTELLSEVQKNLLRISWQRTNKAGGPSGIGAMIFGRIFDHCPPIKAMFGFGDVSSSKLVYNKQFERHAKTFVSIINDAVQHVDNLDLYCKPKLLQAGRMHIKFESQGFKPKYWDVFADAMTESAMDWTSPGRQHRETVRAWTILVSYIIDKMRQGFEIEKRRVRRQLEEEQIQAHKTSPHSFHPT